MEVSQGSGVCAALCIQRTLCRHVTIGTPMVIFCCLTVFWLFLTVFNEWYTVQIVKTLKTIGVPIATVYQRCTNRQKQSKTVKRQSKQRKWPLVFQSSQVYQDCTNSVTIVYQSSTRTWLSQTDRASAAHTIRRGIHRPKYYTVTLKSRLRITQGH